MMMYSITLYSRHEKSKSKDVFLLERSQHSLLIECEPDTLNSFAIYIDICIHYIMHLHNGIMKLPVHCNIHNISTSKNSTQPSEADDIQCGIMSIAAMHDISCVVSVISLISSDINMMNAHTNFKVYRVVLQYCTPGDFCERLKFAIFGFLLKSQKFLAAKFNINLMIDIKFWSRNPQKQNFTKPALLQK